MLTSVFHYNTPMERFQGLIAPPWRQVHSKSMEALVSALMY